MSDDAPNYGEAIMNAVSVEAKAVLAFMAKVQKMRALSAEVEKINPAVVEETRELNLQVARSLRRQHKLLQEFLDRGEGTADDRTVAAEYLRLVIHAQAETLSIAAFESSLATSSFSSTMFDPQSVERF
jgi:hypothetical protein